MTDNLYDNNMIQAKTLSLNHQLESIPGDGNYLFRSVADQLMNHPFRPIDIDHITLRKACVNYMKMYRSDLEVIFRM